MGEKIGIWMMTWDKAHLLRKSIEAIVRHLGYEHPIHIVKTVPHVKQIDDELQYQMERHPNIKVELHRHYGGTLNAWITSIKEHSEFDYVLKIDDDVFVTTDNMAELLLETHHKMDAAFVLPIMTISSQGAQILFDVLGIREEAENNDRLRAVPRNQDRGKFDFCIGSPAASIWLWKKILGVDKTKQAIEDYFCEDYSEPPKKASEEPKVITKKPQTSRCRAPIRVNRWANIGAMLCRRDWLLQITSEAGADERLINQWIGYNLHHRMGEPQSPRAEAYIDQRCLVYHFSYNDWYCSVMHEIWEHIYDKDF